MVVTSKSRDEVILDRVSKMDGSMCELDVLMNLAEQLLWQDDSLRLEYISPAEGSYMDAKEELASRVGLDGRIVMADHINAYDLVLKGETNIYVEAKGHTSHTGQHFQKGYSQCILNGSHELSSYDEYALAIPADAIGILWDKWTTSEGDIPWGLRAQIEMADRVEGKLSIYLVLDGYHLKTSWREFLNMNLSNKTVIEGLTEIME